MYSTYYFTLKCINWLYDTRRTTNYEENLYSMPYLSSDDQNYEKTIAKFLFTDFTPRGLF
jgi:hypothetical protein